MQKKENAPERNSGKPVKNFTRKCGFWINVKMRTIDTPQIYMTLVSM